jgi:Phage gp6-like head-tail connector protein
MADLTTLASAKLWLSESSSSNDQLITQLIGAASDYIQTWLNRTFAVATYTEVRDGTGGYGLATKAHPITAVLSVTVNGVAIPQATNAQMSGWLVNDPGTMIYLRGYQFSRGRGNVTFSYTSGFAVVPKEIEQACIELVGLRYRERDRIGVVSKGLAGESISFSQKDFSDAIETTLTNYKKVVLL